MKLPTALHTTRLSVVRPDVALAEKLAHALNASYELHRDFLAWSKPYWSLLDAQGILQRSIDDFSSPSAEKKFFLLEQGENPTLVGCIGLRPKTGDFHEFEIGYWASQLHANQGLMKEALTALVSELHQYTLRLTTSSANLPSQKLAKAAGFERIETIPNARTSGRFGICDTLVYQRVAS